MKKFTKDVVSVIIPCYNAADCVGKQLSSILSQDYPYIEVIAINDGSKDDTERVLKSFAKLFEEKGYKFCVESQQNGGQATVLNRGLNLITGEFLVWPDSDDYYYITLRFQLWCLC